MAMPRLVPRSPIEDLSGSTGPGNESPPGRCVVRPDAATFSLAIQR
jgi:hypothetical protein